MRLSPIIQHLKSKQAELGLTDVSDAAMVADALQSVKRCPAVIVVPAATIRQGGGGSMHQRQMLTRRFTCVFILELPNSRDGMGAADVVTEIAEPVVLALSNFRPPDATGLCVPEGGKAVSFKKGRLAWAEEFTFPENWTNTGG